VVWPRNWGKSDLSFGKNLDLSLYSEFGKGGLTEADEAGAADFSWDAFSEAVEVMLAVAVLLRARNQFVRNSALADRGFAACDR
jgi:hypothetical protein